MLSLSHTHSHSNTIPVGKYTWTYRRSELDSVTKKRDLPVLLVHGLGSSSYSYRESLALLGGEGYDAVAPDVIGSGDSDKPSDFPCTEEAYVKALDEFIAAIGFEKPFALVVQVRMGQGL
jgi:pimeloyl-ACP methyl ester carboxylesterase